MTKSILKKFKQEINQKQLNSFEPRTKNGKKRGNKRFDKKVISLASEKLNKFDLKFNKEKFQVLNRKGVKKISRPGVSSSKSNTLRQQTLGFELENKNRTGLVKDKRIGENDENMSLEDKMLMRFMKEKTKQHEKKTDFNLGDDDQEYNLGMGLDGRNSDNDDDGDGFERVEQRRVFYNEEQDDGNIDASVVKYTHFGGFEADPHDKDPNAHKSRAEIMKEIIAKSKTFKRERQLQKEKDLDLQHDVDKDLDEIRGLLAKTSDPGPTVASEGRMVISADRLRFLNGQEPLPEKELANIQATLAKKLTADKEYDLFLHQLVGEKRARATDRTKTDLEIAMDAKRDLEAAEAARLKRCAGLDPDISEDEQEHKGKRRKTVTGGGQREGQADDLGEIGYHAGVADKIQKEEIMPLTYTKEGVLVNDVIFMKPRIDSEEEEEDCAIESENDTDSNSSDADSNNLGTDSYSDADIDAKADGISLIAEPISEELDEYKSASEEAEESQQEEIDSDQNELEAMYSDDSEQDENREKSRPSRNKKSISKDEIEKATKEVPFTFPCPDTYADFEILVADRTPEQVLIIIKRLLILYNMTIATENKPKLEKLAPIFMQHVVHLAKQSPVDLELINQIRKRCTDLARLFPEVFGGWIRKELVCVRDQFNKNAAKLTRPKKVLQSVFPELGHLMLFKDISRIYSCSDLRHAVATPAMLVMCQFLGQAPIYTFKDAISGYLLCESLYEYTVESKRFVPEAISFMYQVITISLNQCGKVATPKLLPTLNPIKAKLEITDFEAAYSAELSIFESFSLDFSNDKNKQNMDNLKLFHLCVTLMGKYCKQLAQWVSIIPLFEPLVLMLDKVPNSASSQLKTTYSLDKHYDPDRERAAAKKDAYEYKKEFKGAIRELRKDAAFLAREKIQAIKEGDALYKKKMDQAVGVLAQQEGAMRGYEKMEKKQKLKMKEGKV